MQGLIDAEKEQRKRQKKQKGFVEEEEEKPKLEELEAGYGAFENGDTGLGERRSVTLCPSHHISDPTPAGCIAMFGGICTPCPGTWIDRSRDPTSYTANAIWQHQLAVVGVLNVPFEACSVVAWFPHDFTLYMSALSLLILPSSTSKVLLRSTAES